MKTNFTLRNFIKIRLLLVIILLINCMFLVSQTKNVSIDYLRNTPRHTKSLLLGYHYGANSENPMFLSQAFLLNYNSTKFKFGLSYEFPFFGPSGTDSAKMQNIKSLFRNVELSFNFGLWNKVKEEDIKVEYNEGYNKWRVDVPVNYYRTRGIHTGLSSLNTFIEIKEDFYDYNKTTLFFGYFWAKQSNYAFRVDNRSKSGIRFHESYFDLFYAPASTDVFIKANTQSLPFGFRFGSNVYSQRNLGFNFKFEVGMMPKNYVDNGNSNTKFLYLKSGIGINIAYRKVGQPIEKDFDFGAGSYTGGNKSNSSVNKLIEQGSAYYKAENYKLAIQKFEEALRNISTPSKEHATMFYELGDSYFKVSESRSEYPKVIETMKKSYELDPSKNVMAPVTIFICNRYSKNYDEAIKWYYISIAHPLCNQNLRKLLDGWYEEMKNEKGSDTGNYQNNNKVNVNTLIEQGSAYYKAENYRLAIQKFEEALRNISTPTKQHATMFYELGNSYFKISESTTEYPKVIETMKKSYELDPTQNVMAPVTIFICNRHSNNYDEAIRWYYLSIAHPLCNETLRKLLDGWYDEVKREAKTNTNYSSTDNNQQINNANELFESKQYALAIPKYEAILNGIPVKTKEHAALYYKLGYSYFNVANDVSEYNDVINLLKKSYDLDPNYNCMVPATIFICYKQLKNKEAAIIWYYVSIANPLCNQKQKDLLLEYYNEMLKN